MSRDERYIHVPNWEKFQHYSERNPPWIKLYTHLTAHDDWLELTLFERGVLVTVWLEYARGSEVLSVRSLSRGHEMPVRNVLRALESLARQGFIEILASKALALARVRQRREEKKPLTPLGKTAEKPRREQKPEWRPNEPARTNVQARDPVAAITAMIRNGVIRDQVDLDAELAGLNTGVEPHLADELRSLLELQSVTNLLEGERT